MAGTLGLVRLVEKRGQDQVKDPVPFFSMAPPTGNITGRAD
jgi:hypothetical protein